MPRFQPRPRPNDTLALCLGLALLLVASSTASAYPHPWSIGHRGGSAQRPENTLVAYDFSLTNGADGVEFDVWLSADGVPVCHHDFTVDRTTNGTGLVYLKTLAELKALDAGSWFDPAYAGEQIPSMVEALDVVVGRGKLFLDIKDAGYVPAIVQVLEDYEFPVDDIWIWNRIGTAPSFKQLMPEAHVISAVAHSVDIEEQILVFIGAGYDGIDEASSDVTPESVDLAHSYGMLLMTNTVISPFFTSQIDLGVDIIVATAPTLLAPLLPGPTPECADGLDNDGDGDLDYPDDSSCFGPEDATEEDECSDGIDNDGNGDTDYPADPGCYAAFSHTENPECSDGVDNNGDGNTDYPADTGCFAVYDQAERAYCNDGKDNDGDGLTDYPSDPDCPFVWSNGEVPQCSDGLDNDGDGDIDFPDDLFCSSPHDISEAGPPKVPALSGPARLLAAAALILAMLWVGRSRPSSKSPA